MFVLLVFCYCLNLLTAVPFSEEYKTRRNAGAPRIIGGDIAREGQFKFLAGIRVQTAASSYFCGGAILTTEWVITSAHCAAGATIFVIKLGSTTLNDDSPHMVTMSADQYELHPDYDPDTLAYDLALIQLRLPITYTDYIRPIDMLPTFPLVVDSELVTMGWGQISDSEAGIQEHVHWVYVTAISNDKCKLYYGAQILDSMTCAEGNYNEGLCFGDTGGPLVQYVTWQHVSLVGIASFISQNGCESTDPSGYSRVYDAVDWIRNITGFVEK